MILAYCLCLACIGLSIHCLKLTHTTWRARQPYKAYRAYAVMAFVAAMAIAQWCWSLAMALPLVVFSYGYLAFIYIVIGSAKKAGQVNEH